MFPKNARVARVNSRKPEQINRSHRTRASEQIKVRYIIYPTRENCSQQEPP